MSGNESIIKVTDLSKRFGGIRALKGISLEVRYGEVHALVGENGAGKSTLMNILGGIIQRDTGEVLYQGQPVQFVRVGAGRPAGWWRRGGRPAG